MFKPDYDFWWNKKDLTAEELSVLIFGLDPKHFFKYLEIGNRGERTKEEIDFMNSYHDHVTEQPQWNDIYRINELRLDLLNRDAWGSGKHNFVKFVYEEGLRYAGCFMHTEFLDYLASNNEKPVHFDHYENHVQYAGRIKEDLERGISSEDEAISFLLGLEPKWFVKKCELHNKKWDTCTAEEKFFERQYWVFLKNYYGDMDWAHIIVRTYHDIKKLNLWDGDFDRFVQSLHDLGYVFRNEVVEALKDSNVMPRYSEDGSIYRFYQSHIKDELWSFDTAIYLYKGYKPEDESQLITDLGQQQLLITKMMKNEWRYWDSDREMYLPLRDRLIKHIKAGLIDAVDIDGEYHFRPETIVSWIKENTRLKISPILIQALNLTSLEEEECSEDDIKLEKAKLNRRNELHDVIGMAIVDMGYKNKKAPSNDIWNYIKNHQDSYGCIQEVTDTEISWCSYRGTEQDMKRERFNNVVSEYNTGKKSYPGAE